MLSGRTSRYGENVIFRNVSFQVMKGESLSSWAEVATANPPSLKHMFGLNKPASGRCCWTALMLPLKMNTELARLRRHIGVLFQSGALFWFHDSG